MQNDDYSVQLHLLNVVEENVSFIIGVHQLKIYGKI